MYFKLKCLSSSFRARQLKSVEQFEDKVHITFQQVDVVDV